MPLVEICFWVSVFLILYPYFIYPLILFLVSRVFQRKVRRDAAARSVSIVLAARNEQDGIQRRLRELLALLDDNPGFGEIIVVSDGSTDDTVALVSQIGDPRVRLVELVQRFGKAEALNRGVAVARYDVVVFADTRQTWDAKALRLLLENFADDHVGAVSGDLVLQEASGAMVGVGLYWRYEKWLRTTESNIDTQIGVTGAISACRRDLYSPIPIGTVLDDVYWPMQVAMKGYRVIHDSRAVAYDRLPDKAKDEFRRKVRTLAGNFQLVARLPQALLPYRNPICLQFVSHKLARLAVPWALVGVFVFGLWCDGWVHDLAVLSQVIVYALGVVGLVSRRGGWLGAAASFLILNAAAWVAFWVWLTGKAEKSWKPVAYTPAPTPVALKTLPSGVELRLPEPDRRPAASPDHSSTSV